MNQPLQRGDAFGGAQHQVVAGFAGALLDAGGDAAHEGSLMVLPVVRGVM